MPPPTTARGTPSGIKMDDGFSTKIGFELAPTISFWEKSVKPPGWDGGAAVDTTTMHNVQYRTMSPRHLITMTDQSTKVAYDPNLYNTILSTINVEQGVTIHFPDGSTLDFYGFLQKFEPDALEEGKQPEATVSITATNQHPITGVETPPVLTSVAGT